MRKRFDRRFQSMCLYYLWLHLMNLTHLLDRVGIQLEIVNLLKDYLTIKEEGTVVYLQ